MEHEKHTGHVLVLRWIARGYAAISALVILLLFYGEIRSFGFDSLLPLSKLETLMMVMVWVMWAGLLIGWKSERWGAGLILGGFILFCIPDLVDSGSLPGAMFFVFYLIPGVMYLYCSLRSH